nr:DUF6580 family putative transport protein [Leptospira ryugenii]
MFSRRLFTVLFMVLVAAASRLLPHPPNFTPILAVSLFAGAYIVPRKWAFLVPVVAMFLSDLVIGLHELLPLVYLCMMLSVFLGSHLGQKPKLTSTFGLSVLSSVFFFFVTNLAVWLTSGMYSLDWIGFISCFTLALPFFQNSIVGDLFFTGVLFGSMYVIEKTWLGQSEAVYVRANKG